MSAYNIYLALSFDGVNGLAFLGFALLLVVLAAGLSLSAMLRERGLGEIVFDLERGGIRISRTYEIAFSRMRRLEVVEHEYTYRAMGPDGLGNAPEKQSGSRRNQGEPCRASSEDVPEAQDAR